MISIFKELDLNHLVILRGVPNGSTRNKIERDMIAVNLPLSFMQVRCQSMPKWTENELKSSSSMKEVRYVGENLDKRRKKEAADMLDLEKKCNNLAIAEEVTYGIQNIIKSGSE